MDLREVTEFLKDASKYLIVLVVMVVLFTFVVAFQPVAGNSMFPTLQEGNVIMVSRFTKNFQRNEIVSLKSHDKSFVKRIVGLLGERVDYLNDVLYINGEGFQEKFLGEGIKTSNFTFEDICSKEDCPDGVIPENMYLVLGDNRPQSEDSRTPGFGLISKDDIVGKVFFRVWPVSSFGKV